MSDAIRCDGCGTFAPRPNPWGGYMARGNEKVWGPHDVPDGWVSLSARSHPFDMGVETDCRGEFCGWRCAAEWFALYAQRTAPCCRLHNEPACCDENDCGPCCGDCPTCPTLARRTKP